MNPDYYPPPAAQPTTGRPWPGDRVLIGNMWATVDLRDYYSNSSMFPVRFDHRPGVVQMRFPSEIQQRTSTRETLCRLNRTTGNSTNPATRGADFTAATAPAEPRKRTARHEGVA